MQNKVNCLICNGEGRIIYNHYPGYVQGTEYDIYHCDNCDLNFISVPSIDKKLYKTIYSNNGVEGYDRYLKYANEIKSKTNPLRYLALQESTYFPVYRYLSDKTNLKILEIGCGYGYLSFAMKKSGHNVLAVDVSAPAIEFALSNFGDHYKNIDFDTFIKSGSESYDLIIATELIEHLVNPLEFVKMCSSRLTENGKILLTTPNKDYRRRNAIWQTDLPPVHTTWLSRKSMRRIAELCNMDIEFIQFTSYYPAAENRLVKYLRGRNEYIQSALIKMDGTTIEKKKNSNVHDLISAMLHRVPPVRVVSNFIYNLFFKDDITLGAIIKKKD